MKWTHCIVIALLGTGSLLAQTASATNYGRGCQLSGSPPPLIRALQRPILGTTATVRFTGPNSITPVSQDQPILITGFKQISLAIPPLSSIKISGCKLLTTPDFINIMPKSGTAYQGSMAFKIPNNKSLAGLTLYQQFVSVYRNCRSGPCIDQMLRTSDGLKLVLGAS